MENHSQPQNDLLAIRQMMERSSKFLSLSGLSGIFAGCVAIIGATFTYFNVLDRSQIKYDEYFRSVTQTSTWEVRAQLIVTALIILFIALSGAFYFSYRKAKKSGQKIWNKTTRQLLIQLFIPLVAGGLFSILLIWHNNMQLVASTTLIFYGLALVNAGKFTFGEIHYLGISEIILGLVSGIFLDYGLLFWTLGFGVLHIVYGWVMYRKYDKIK